ncbi:hypothetical protein K2173_008892 [Erythroxylum novogranatense]|uniref:Homeobox domain-containing protein n=1 Tax=Erythroxylum novogranatense TaxID=1862640 RepID=A0AAV8S4T8_9ROSI|nr:hypothetical protein K2173_008892 [Erythroxylum novogranatense]
MAEGYEPYHVPQQSRRDKLRVVAQQNHHELQACAGLFPMYDPSLLSSDLLASCANNSLSGVTEACKANPVCVVKEEGSNLIAFTGGIVNASSSSSSPSTHHHHHLYLDPRSSLSVNPSSIQDVNSNPFLYTSHSLQSLRDFDQPYNSEVIVFKPEPLSLTRHDSNATGQGLSLSLSSHHPHQSNLPLELNLQRYGSAIYTDKISSGGGVCIVPGTGSSSNDVSRSSVPLGPFTGYASILKGSRFLRPAQQLLEELCDVGRGIYGQKITVDASLMDPPIECLSASEIVDDPVNCGNGSESRRKKSRLVSMLDEVYRKYKQYYQQMQAVVASFECVSGLGNAAPYANLALKAMSKHFKSLKNAIADQLQFNNKSQGQIFHGKEEATRFADTDRGIYNQRPVQNPGFIEHQPVWRPQRGLPERAVTVLRAWLFEHFLHPYPTDTDKLMLAKQTGLSRSQVSNWFINARVRLWKPMVEEIHMLETRQVQKVSQRDDRNTKFLGDQVPMSNPSTSTHRVRDVPLKRTRNEVPNVPEGSGEPLDLSYNSLSNHAQMGVVMSMAGPTSGVSLTLGLHQNNGMGFPESFPMNAAQRLGLNLGRIVKGTY